MNFIEVQGVTKVYGKGQAATHALRNVSLSVKRGEFVAVTGRSGCGKSSLLNILGGMDTPTEGEYYYDEMKVSSMSVSKLAKFRSEKIGFVFQAFHLMPELNAMGNVEVPMGYAGVSASVRHQRSQELLTQVGLESRMSHHPSELSGGEQQRVAIARALANKPALILADEPTGNLDEENGDMIMKLLRKLNEDGLTIIMVTHDKDLAANADRIIHMADGCIV